MPREKVKFSGLINAKWGENEGRYNTQILIKYLVYTTKKSCKFWILNSEQSRQGPYFYGVYNLLEIEGDKHWINTNKYLLWQGEIRALKIKQHHEDMNLHSKPYIKWP